MGPAGKVRTEHVQNKLRAMGYTFKKQASRATIWKKPGVFAPVHLPRRDLLHLTEARSILMNAGCSEDDFVEFVRSCG